jgi:hypothetical protein
MPRHRVDQGDVVPEAREVTRIAAGATAHAEHASGRPRQESGRELAEPRHLQPTDVGVQALSSTSRFS